jgi:hypothetical protein
MEQGAPTFRCHDEFVVKLSLASDMIVVSRLKCPGCGHSGTAEWKAYRPKFLKELQMVRGRFIPNGPGRGSVGAFLCESCRCLAQSSDDPAIARI